MGARSLTMVETQPTPTGRAFRRLGPPPPATPEALAELQARLTRRPAEPAPASPAGHHPHPAPDAPRYEWAQYFHRLGFCLCAIPPGKKGPITPGWPEGNLPPEYWLTHPQEGLGVVLGPSRLVSLDLDSLSDARAVLDALGLKLDPLLSGAMLVRGNPERLRAIFRAPPDLDLTRKSLAWPPREEGGKPVTVFELRGGPVQDVLPPTIHPDTGRPYEWITPPWELPKLGTLPPALGELWADWDQWRPHLEALCPWAPEPEVKAPPRERAGGESVIDAFNAAHDPAAILASHGYKPKGPNRWLSPFSSSGLAGVVRLSQTGRIHCHHASDPLAGPPHDAFSLFTVLEHGGDHREAVKAAARLLGIATPSEPRAVEDPPPEAGDWPAPQPLTASIEALPYPLDAFPDLIREAIAEAFAFTKAPLALVASAALSALSLAGQHLADVRRAERLTGPAGLYLLTLGDSGERKSTADALFLAPLRAWEREQAQARERELKDYQAELTAWESERNGIKERIRGLARAGKTTEQARLQLRDLEGHKPTPPLIPRLIFQDATPEALAWNLAKGWPAGGIVSAEGGAVLGAHGMGKDSILRSLALLNSLWDAAPLTIDRRTADSFTVRAARVSLSLMIQEAPLRDFLDKSGTLARGSGFLARVLLAWPESTQGTRFFSAPPADWPALAAFHARLRALLSQPLPLDERGDLSPPVLPLDPDAYQAWIGFHDALEAELGEGGELRMVRDVASKAADNAARLACLFHLCAHGPAGRIGADAFGQAARIVAWHLSESRRFFGEIALPPELADAARLDRWLTDTATREGAASLAKNHARRFGPLRDRARLEAALTELRDLDRLRVVREGRQFQVWLNPALLGAKP